MIDWESIKGVLTEEQFKILQLFLEEKQSIRNITQIVGMGRTKVGNILEACVGLDDELDKAIELRKLNLRTHKNAVDVSEIDLINKIPNIERVEPMTHCLDNFEYVLREDVVEESTDIDELLQNCDLTLDREVKVPKVVE
mgnify:CR=1 FL=1